MSENDAPQQPPPTIEQRFAAINQREMAAEAAPEPAGDAEPVEPAGDAPEAQEAPQEAAEGPGDAPAAEESAASAEQAEAEEIIELGEDGLTPQEIAERLDLDVEDVYKHGVIPIQLGGDRHMVNFHDLKNTWKESQETTNLKQQLEQQQSQWQAQQRELEATAQARVTEAAGLADQLEAFMLSQFNDVDWAQLRADDPAEWAARRQSLQETSARVNQMRAAVGEKLQQHQRELAVQHQEQIQALMTRERAALVKADPEFGDAERGPVKMQALRSYLQRTGFTEQEVSNALDHRLIIMAEKARQWDESQKASAPLRKKVVKVAKAGKPGARQSKAEQQHDRTRALRAQLKKTGHVDAAAELFSQLNKRS